MQDGDIQGRVVRPMDGWGCPVKVDETHGRVGRLLRPMEDGYVQGRIVRSMEDGDVQGRLVRPMYRWEGW